MNARSNAFDRYKTHLLLAHLVEEDLRYLSFYQRQYKTLNADNDGVPVDRRIEIDFNGNQVPIVASTAELFNTPTNLEYSPLYNRDKTYILDNSAFELYSRGQPMFDADKLIDLGKKCHADYIVLPDYPGENGFKTIEAAHQYAPQFKAAGFGTFFVPQSEIGDIENYIETFAWAAASPLIDYIGVSILGVPNAYGVYESQLNRYLSRVTMMRELAQRGILDLARRNGKKIHFLGMLDGPKEIDLVSPFIKQGYINTWDSSAAVWAGIEGVAFDDTPTGLINGKVKSHVDFDRAFDESKLNLIKRNMDVIDRLVTKYSPVK